jgi:hypothetical protein
MSKKTINDLDAIASVTSNDLLPIWDADTGTTKKATAADIAALAGGGGGENLITPVVTPVDPAPVNEGQTWTAAQICDTAHVNWLFTDYSGPGGGTIGFENGVVGGVENVPGTYTANVRAGNVFGISEPQQITIVVNPFTLTRDTAFGTWDELRAFEDDGTSELYYAITGVARYDGGTYYVTRENATWATAEDHLMFYSPVTEQLIAFRVGSGGTVDAVKLWTGVPDATEGAALSGSGLGGYTSGTDLTQMLARSVRGKKYPMAYYDWFGSGGHGLEITPTPGSGWANSFGTKNQDWSYGFTLADDWCAGTGAAQMLVPRDVADGWHIFGLAGYGIGTSPYDYLAYGNSTSGPFSTSSGVTFNVDTQEWKIGSAGDVVIVTFDSATNTHKVYVNAVEFYSGSSSASTYMTTSATTDPVLSFGDHSNTNGGSIPVDEQDPSAWMTAIDDLWIANGVTFSAAQVTEITAHGSDATASDNYGDMDFYFTLDGVGTTVVKGAATVARTTVNWT